MASNSTNVYNLKQLDVDKLVSFIVKVGKWKRINLVVDTKWENLRLGLKLFDKITADKVNVTNFIVFDEMTNFDMIWNRLQSDLNHTRIFVVFLKSFNEKKFICKAAKLNLQRSGHLFINAFMGNQSGNCMQNCLFYFQGSFISLNGLNQSETWPRDHSDVDYIKGVLDENFKWNDITIAVLSTLLVVVNIFITLYAHRNILRKLIFKKESILHLVATDDLMADLSIVAINVILLMNIFLRMTPFDAMIFPCSVRFVATHASQTWLHSAICMKLRKFKHSFLNSLPLKEWHRWTGFHFITPMVLTTVILAIAKQATQPSTYLDVVYDNILFNQDFSNATVRFVHACVSYDVLDVTKQNVLTTILMLWQIFLVVLLATSAIESRQFWIQACMKEIVKCRVFVAIMLPMHLPILISLQTTETFNQPRIRDNIIELWYFCLILAVTLVFFGDNMVEIGKRIVKRPYRRILPKVTFEHDRKLSIVDLNSIINSGSPVSLLENGGALSQLLTISTLAPASIFFRGVTPPPTEQKLRRVSSIGVKTVRFVETIEVWNN